MRDAGTQDRPIEKPKSKKHLFVYGSLAFVALALTVPIAQRWLSTELAVSASRLRTAEVQVGQFVRDVAVQGRVIAAVAPTLYSPEAGTVTLLVRAGETVQEHQILATVDSPELNNRLQTEQATLESEEVELERTLIEAKQTQLENHQRIDLAKIALDAADREKRRADLSIQANAISKLDHEKALDELTTAHVKYEHAVQDARLSKERLAFEQRTKELMVQRQRLMVEELQRQVDELAVRSPATGVVGTMMAEQKAAVDRNQPLLSVVDLSAYEIELQVPQSYGDDLSTGVGTEITYEGRVYAGQIATVSPEIQNNQVMARVRFSGDLPEGLRQNQRVSTRIILESRDNVTTVQRGPFYDSGGGRIAYVVEDGYANRRDIDTGATSVNAIEILDGLRPGETIEDLDCVY
ncbi:MAG: HlyD family efflux transporter periplasmic adaptor subunit, partial [Gammaproteobacteria bacterium]